MAGWEKCSRWFFCFEFIDKSRPSTQCWKAKIDYKSYFDAIYYHSLAKSSCDINENWINLVMQTPSTFEMNFNFKERWTQAMQIFVDFFSSLFFQICVLNETPIGWILRMQLSVIASSSIFLVNYNEKPHQFPFHLDASFDAVMD